ncbi:MAG: M67 family metallopeptidase, partial [Planctomycetota bacterium]
MRIVADTYRSLIRHAQAAWPYECCGIMLAEEGSPELVSMVMPSRNMAAERRERQYRLDHRVQLLALEL